MRALLQRVSSAQVKVEGQITGAIERDEDDLTEQGGFGKAFGRGVHGRDSQARSLSSKYWDVQDVDLQDRLEIRKTNCIKDYITEICKPLGQRKYEDENGNVFVEKDNQHIEFLSMSESN